MTTNENGCGACREGDTFPLTMAFQPIIDLQTGRIDAHEALVRGLQGQSAGEVLGAVTAENRYRFDQTCRTKAITLAASLGMECQLNINFLPNAVYNPKSCIRTTLLAAQKSGFPLERITFEIVEDERAKDLVHLSAIIEEYRRQGFKIALDDFATAYSGLARLAELKPDIIKLDRVLVQNCDQDRSRLAIVATMLSLGAELGIKIVIEGVERIEEVEVLRAAGARFMQGFYFARPQFEAIASHEAIPWPRVRQVAHAG